MAVSSIRVLILLCVASMVPSTIWAISEADRRLILDCHNRYRSTVARGQARNRDGSNLPPATAMVRFVYDTTIEATAQEWGNRCTFQHSTGRLGENLHMTTAENVTDASELQISCDNWYKELADLGFPSNLIFLPPPGVEIGHFTQQIWAETTRMGCAVARCPDGQYKTYVVCNYDPPGNVIGTSVYTPGPTCSGCASQYPGSTCQNGLCVLPQQDNANLPVTSTTTTTTTTTTTPTTTTTTPTTTTTTPTTTTTTPTTTTTTPTITTTTPTTTTTTPTITTTTPTTTITPTPTTSTSTTPSTTTPTTITTTPTTTTSTSTTPSTTTTARRCKPRY